MLPKAKVKDEATPVGDQIQDVLKAIRVQVGMTENDREWRVCKGLWLISHNFWWSMFKFDQTEHKWIAWIL